MSDSPEPFWPGSRDLQALVHRTVAQSVDPVRTQLDAVGRALGLLAERMPPPHQAGDLASRVDAIAEQLAGLAGQVERLAGQADAGPDLLEKVAALDAFLTTESSSRRAQTDELRQALAVAVSHAVSKIDQARGDSQAEELRQTVTTAIEQSLVGIEAAAAHDSARLSDQVAALEAPLLREAEARERQTEEVRTAVAATLEGSLAELEAARAADTATLDRSLAALESARAFDTTTIERRLAAIEAARTADTIRVLEAVAAVQESQAQDPGDHRTLLDELRRTLATTVEEAVDRIDTTRTADASPLLDQVAGLVARIEADAQRRDVQAGALLAAVDERLMALHTAGTGAGEASEGRLASRLEAVTEEHGRALLARIDERPAGSTDLDAIGVRVAAEVNDATAAALSSRVEPLVARLLDAVDALAHEGGRIDALARGHAGEARAVEERVASMFTDVAERAESAVDRSRARIAEGQVALGGRLDAVAAELQAAIDAAADRVGARLSDSADGLLSSGGHQNAALLDVVTRSSQQLGDGLAELRAALAASRTGPAGGDDGEEAEARAAALAAQLGRLQATVDEVADLSSTTLEDLRASQTALRGAVQDGAHKADLAALDVRGLRERLTPHLVALAEATNRRAEADQAGFDAVLARLDQLLAASQH